MKRRTTVASQNSTPLKRRLPAVYPFAAIVGQEEMKLALLLNVIAPSIGGVLLMGHRGTGKSTAVRALADLLPQIWRVRGCLYGCDPADEMSLCDDCLARLASNGKLPRERGSVPVVDLPLGSTEDRVCGTINIERALKEGVKAFEPGLLARAHRGFLYIDEVNLLEDHLVDLLLDVAVTGRNVVEREGVSAEHPARFVLVGSGNPEEGELRPQLIDRFGLHVEVKTAGDLDERVRIVERREAFERDPESFRARVESEQEQLRRRIQRARKNVDTVKLSRTMLRRIAELCEQLNVDGHRGELTIARVARALAAFEGRREVTDADVRRVATMALRHRLRRDPLEQSQGGARIEQRLDKLFPQDAAAERDERRADKPTPSSTPGGDNGSGGAGRRLEKEATGSGTGSERNVPPALDARLSSETFKMNIHSQRKPDSQSTSARRSAERRRNRYGTLRGRYTSATQTKTPDSKIALDATLRAAVGSRQWAVGRKKRAAQFSLPTAHCLLPTDLRYKRFKRKAGTLFIFAIDTSGSMALNRIAQAKGALVRLLQQSYIRRDRVALVSFRGEGAELLLPPSASVTRARRLLDEQSIGGATPLPAGLMRALEVAARAAEQGTERIVLLLFTDGRANVPLRMRETQSKDAQRSLIEDELVWLGAGLRKACVTTVVVDTQSRFTSIGTGKRLAEIIGAEYVQLESAVDGAS